MGMLLQAGAAVVLAFLLYRGWRLEREMVQNAQMMEDALVRLERTERAVAQVVQQASPVAAADGTPFDLAPYAARVDAVAVALGKLLPQPPLPPDVPATD